MPQLFINFRGKDERQKLLPHLKHHLKDSNVNVFTDDDAVGEPLKNLFKHIRRSRIVIVIFSINYMESEWCLDELVEIRKCLETEKIDFAIPIFYKVKTSHVKEQSGKFGKKIVALQKKHRSSRIIKWKKALRYVAKLIGLTYQKRSLISELDFIKKIVEMVDVTLTKIASEDDDNNNSPETSKGETSNLIDVNKMLNLSRTLDTRDMEISYRQGFMVGSAWKDGIISSMRSRSYNWRVLIRGLFCLLIFLLSSKYQHAQDYRRTFSYHNNIYQYPHWPQVTGLNQYPTRSRRRSGNLFSSCRNSALSTVIANLFSSDFDQYPTIGPTSMHDDIVSTSHAAEAKDRTSFTSLDSVDRYSTTTSMHNHRVLASHDAETEEITTYLTPKMWAKLSNDLHLFGSNGCGNVCIQKSSSCKKSQQLGLRQ
ncbi:hypothetical protein Bca4012_080210 [Brassica carinata]